MALRLPWRKSVLGATFERGAGIRVILHAKAAMAGDLRAAITQLRETGCDIEVRVTWEPGDAEQFAEDAAHNPACTSVVAAGGDGTVNAVVSGLMRSGQQNLPSMGVLPLGTANDFARACEIPLGDPLAALRLVAEHAPVAVDVGLVNGRHFLNVATGGFGTELTVNTPNELKKVLGGAAYLLTGVRQASSISARSANIEGPDFSWKGGFLALAVGNGRYAGGGVDMCEHALINNGRFELSILPEVKVEDIPGVLTNLLDFGFSAELLEQHVIRARAQEFTVSSDAELQINLDGEPLHSRHFHFQVLNGAIGLHLPAEAAILGKE
jgi:lipid kinase YegS